MFAHLAQKQAIEVLELNLRLFDSYEQADIDIKFEENITKLIVDSQPALASPSGGANVEVQCVSD